MEEFNITINTYNGKCSFRDLKKLPEIHVIIKDKNRKIIQPDSLDENYVLKWSQCYTKRERSKENPKKYIEKDYYRTIAIGKVSDFIIINPNELLITKNTFISIAANIEEKGGV